MTGLINVTRAVDNETGTRSYSGVAYLEKTAGRGNICVLVNAHSSKIIFSDENGELVAKEVHFDSDGQTYVVQAKKEVILSAGK